MDYLEMTFGREHRTEAARRDNPFQTLEQFDAKIARRTQEDLETRTQIAQAEIDRRNNLTFIQTIVERLAR
jgi:hypothetical protein